MSRQRRVDLAARIGAAVLWSATWAVVFALDPGFDYLLNHPGVLLVLMIAPQMALGYATGLRSTLLVIPLAVAWALIAHADCSVDEECVTLGGILGIAAFWALILGSVIALGRALRLVLARWLQPRT